MPFFVFTGRALRACLLATLGSAVLATGSPSLAATKTDTGVARVEAFEPAESSFGNFLAAMVASASRDTSAAALYMREALKNDPRNVDLAERSFEANLADGNMDEALRLARRIIDRDPRNGLAKLTLGVKALKDRQYVTARSRLALGGRGRTADITNTLLSSWAWLGSNDASKAVQTLDRLQGESAFAVFKDYHAGLILDLANRGTEANLRLKNAYDPSGRGPVRLVDAYARIEARRGTPDVAASIVASFLEKVGRHPSIVALQAELAAGRPIERLIRTPQEGAAEVLFGLGTEGNRQGDEIAAMIYLRLARYLDPKHDMAAVALADIYERLKLYEKAIALYDEVAETSPLAHAADVQVGINLETMGRTDDAIKRLRGAVQDRPTDLEAVSALGNVLRAQKRYPESIAVFTAGIATVPKLERQHWTLLYFRGTAHERAKQWPLGEADLKRALELYPDQPQVLNYLGYSWIDQGLNLEEGFKLLRRAVELAPRDGYIIDSLGWAHYRMGRFEDAVRELERAVMLKPGDPTINDHLGDAYWKVGRKLEAKFQWSHAKDRKPEPDELVKIEVKLEKGLDEPIMPVSAQGPRLSAPGVVDPGVVVPDTSVAPRIPEIEPAPLNLDLTPAVPAAPKAP